MKYNQSGSISIPKAETIKKLQVGGVRRKANKDRDERGAIPWKHYVKGEVKGQGVTRRGEAPSLWFHKENCDGHTIARSST